jgi:hypothetical protein
VEAEASDTRSKCLPALPPIISFEHNTNEQTSAL